MTVMHLSGKELKEVGRKDIVIKRNLIGNLNMAEKVAVPIQKTIKI